METAPRGEETALDFPDMSWGQREGEENLQCLLFTDLGLLFYSQAS